ncbi:SUKH-4 family immunity protein [Streptomyces sp. NPDC004539]|uniref:SUKH-4 family immunity protein n=1 Tax=Streptomyces sp. NPDC004539 TaxID=3154280 RepID=UPI0033B225AD
MNGTATTITFTEDALDPYVTHAPTRRWLTGPGLPGVGGLLTFEALRRDGLRTVGDSTGEARGVLAADLRDQLVIGGLLGARGQETESVLLDGATGAVSTTYFLHDRPDLMDVRPLAPSLEKLVRFATAADELAALRGQFASYAGRFGAQAVAEATKHLLSLYEGETDGEIAPYWKTVAVIRPLSLIAGPGTTSGLALDLPPRLLDEEYGQGEIVRFEEMDVPEALTHASSRHFLTSVGLPEEAVWFTLDTDAPLRTLADYCADELPTHELPPRTAHLIRLGALLEDTSLLLDGETGAVLSYTFPDRTLRPLNADLSTLAFTLWLIHRERTLDALHDLTATYDHLTQAMTHTLATLDPTAVPPTPTDDWRYWPEVFGDESGGGLYA